MNTVIRVEPGITSLILVNSFINNFVSKPCPFKISSTIIFHSKMNKSSPLPNLGLSQSQRPPVPVAIFNTRVKPKAVHAQTEKKKTIQRMKFHLHLKSKLKALLFVFLTIIQMQQLIHAHWKKRYQI